MARGSGKDDREYFNVDTLRMRDRQKGPEQAPSEGTREFYFKKGRAFHMDDDGVERPLESIGFSASPGFTWGRAGLINTAVTANVYLFNDQVVSNKTGRVVAFTDPTLRKIFVTQSAVTTFTVRISEHDGNQAGEATLATIVVTGRTGFATVSVPVTAGRQLAVSIISGTCEDPVVGVVLDGSL